MEFLISLDKEQWRKLKKHLERLGLDDLTEEEIIQELFYLTEGHGLDLRDEVEVRRLR